ncbi:MAG: glycosyltransferase [Burkholderiales bacterium]|nr:glycosyltransferase [Burkholderiales bacterium]MDP2397904.1 glycosyltransferase [Burkholderiales bacterium]
MSRILFAWELGAGVGHLSAFRQIAEVLLRRGHDLTAAVRDLAGAAMVFEGLPVRILPAPACSRNYGGLADPPLSYSEILMRYGYIDAPMLGALLRGWQGLLELAAAELLIADHAPTALLAARGSGVRRCTFGNAFSVPPEVSPSPNMRDWLAVSRERLATSDEAVIGTINAALPSGDAPMTAVHQLFEGSRRLFVGIPELDPYGPREPANYLGLLAGRSGSNRVQWPEGDGPRLFAYLRQEYPHIDSCLAALSGCGARCVVNLVGGRPDQVARHRGPRLSFTAGHVDMLATAAECDAVVCHSGLGTVTATLRAGKPLLLLPAQLEQYLLARNVEKLGAGLTVHPETAAPDFAGSLRRLLDESVYTQRAEALAQRHGSESTADLVEHAALRIESAGAELPG